jgi:hypothetical protein
MRTLTSDMVLEAMGEIVTEHGRDYVYPADLCMYVDYNTVGELRPSCLIGQVLIRLGVVGVGFFVGESINEESIAQMFPCLPVTVSPAALIAMEAAQNTQDGSSVDERGTWGEALDAAIRKNSILISRSV